MRQAFKDQEVGLDPNFTYRGKNQTRIETFSDAAFALAITLLVLSSSVPTTFAELKDSMADVIPFGLCIALIAVIWYQHYVFFLRYGLQNIKIVVANTILIFLILVYVYPLKFLLKFLAVFYTALFSRDFTDFNATYGDLSVDELRFLMIIYGLGVACIFLIISWFYRYAIKHKDDLVLSEYELFITKISMRMNVIQFLVPCLSVLIALFFGYSNIGITISGFTYFLYPIIMPWYGIKAGRKANKILEGKKSIE